MTPKKFRKNISAEIEIVLSEHSERRLKQRQIRKRDFEEDLLNSTPEVVFVQEEEQTHTKFLIYYHQSGNYYHTYAIKVSKKWTRITLITAYRTNKIKQKHISMMG